MRGSRAPLVLSIAAAFASAAAAVSAAADRPSQGHCEVIGGEKLLTHSSGVAAICAEVERAIAHEAPTARYDAKIQVLSPNRLAATLMVDGRALPEQKFAVMDSELTIGSIRRFAQSLAAAVGNASRASGVGRRT